LLNIIHRASDFEEIHFDSKLNSNFYRNRNNKTNNKQTK